MQILICPFCSRQNRLQARYCGDCGRVLAGGAITAIAPVDTQLRWGMALGLDQRYIIRELIGSGGFGEAYLAEDRHHWGRRCLVKRLRIKASTQPALIPLISANFEREARLLVALGHPGHQNIPDIYEYLPDERCLVMKYITGKSLDRVLKRQIEPLPEEEALRYVRDACAALNYMHSHPAGPILHRDLKPSNIMLDSTGRVFLIDFGLARNPSLTHDPSDSSGTHGYMPPEQDRGHPEPRSDIYALGATLYELVTQHRPPHLGNGLIPACQLNPVLRPEVEQLIQRCMAHDLNQRPHANELLTILDDLLESAHIPAPPAPTPLPGRPAALGRDQELRKLGELIQKTHFAVLIGMPGVGKTTLAVSFAHCHPDPELVFWHRFHQGEGADMLIIHLAGWLAWRGYPAIWRQIHHEHQAGQSEKQELQAEYLAQSPAMQGCLLCFDDVHSVAADMTMQRVLARLRQAAAQHGPAMILTTRSLPGFVDPAESIRLQGLQLDALPALLEQRGIQLGQHELRQLWQATEGNPQFLTLAIYAIQLSDEPAQLLDRLSETELIEQYLLQEVDARLSEHERTAMSVIAILLGYGADQSVIEELLDGTPIRRELAALAQRQLLTIEQHETGTVYYQHAIVQSFYYHLQGTRQRQSLHRRAANYFEHSTRDRLNAARHYAHAGEQQQAANLLSTAPWQLFNRGYASAVAELASRLQLDTLAPELQAALLTAHGEALELLGKDEAARLLLEQALEIETSEPVVRRARRHRLLARIYTRRSEHKRAEDHCQRGLALAMQPTARTRRTEAARLYAQLAEIFMRQEQRAEAMQACSAGLDVLPAEPATPAERTTLLQRIATVAGDAGHYDQAISALEQNLGVARQIGDLALTARVLHNLGLFYTYSGAAMKALALLHESVKLKERLGDRSSTIDTFNVIGMAQLAAGDHQAALHSLERGRDLAESYHMRSSFANSVHNIGQVQYEMEEYHASKHNLHQAISIFAEIGEPGEQAACLSLLGDIALKEADPVAAAEYAQQALELARQHGRQPMEAAALRVLAEAQMMGGELASAAEALAQAWSLVEAIGDPYDQALTLGTQARLAGVQGDHQAAVHDARRSLELARQHHIIYLEKAMEEFLQWNQIAQETI